MNSREYYVSTRWNTDEDLWTKYLRPKETTNDGFETRYMSAYDDYYYEEPVSYNWKSDFSLAEALNGFLEKPSCREYAIVNQTRDFGEINTDGVDIHSLLGSDEVLHEK